MEDPIEFFEVGEEWSPIPNWAAFLLSYGYQWRSGSAERKICLISMPCDSAGALLVALGAMRCRLEQEHANDLGRHHARLKNLPELPPHQRPRLRHIHRRGLFEFHESGSSGILWLRKVGSEGNERLAILDANITEWLFDGEPPVQARQGAPLAYYDLLQRLIPHSGAIRRANLSWSDSAICLAGRIAGKAATQTLGDAVQFSYGAERAALSELLGVQGWHEGETSRVQFFNAHTSTFDREAGRPELLVADGHGAFMRTIDHPSFSTSDVIAVLPRTVDFELSERLADKLSSLSQWFSRQVDESVRCALPPGIAVAVLTAKP
mgnify:CR=1 FL=1